MEISFSEMVKFATDFFEEMREITPVLWRSKEVADAESIKREAIQMFHIHDVNLDGVISWGEYQGPKGPPPVPVSASYSYSHDGKEL